MTAVQYGGFAISMALLIVFLVFGYKSHKRVMRHLTEGPTKDPFVPQVRALRELWKSNAAVAIHDEDTGAHYYYPKGSEVRMKANEKNRIYIDFEDVAQNKNGSK